MIDKQKIIDGLECCSGRVSCSSCPYNGIDDCIDVLKRRALELLKSQPEVVQCEDCKNWIPGTIDDDDNFNPPRCKRIIGRWSANEYCSCAERKDDRGADEG